jgi:hypothetical protein
MPGGNEPNALGGTPESTEARPGAAGGRTVRTGGRAGWANDNDDGDDEAIWVKWGGSLPVGGRTEGGSPGGMPPGFVITGGARAGEPGIGAGAARAGPPTGAPPARGGSTTGGPDAGMAGPGLGAVPGVAAVPSGAAAEEGGMPLETGGAAAWPRPRPRREGARTGAPTGGGG